MLVFIDSLDQISNSDPAHSKPWEWLPEAVPEHAAVVVSTLPDEAGGTFGILPAFRERCAADGAGGALQRGDFVEVNIMEESEAMLLFDDWLAASGRVLTSEQRDEVALAINGAEVDGEVTGAVTMLHLKLLFDLAVREKNIYVYMGNGKSGKSARPTQTLVYTLSATPQWSNSLSLARLR